MEKLLFFLTGIILIYIGLKSIITRKFKQTSDTTAGDEYRMITGIGAIFWGIVFFLFGVLAIKLGIEL